MTERGFPPGLSTPVSTFGVSSAGVYPQVSPQVFGAGVGERTILRQTRDVNQYGALNASTAIIIIR